GSIVVATCGRLPLANYVLPHEVAGGGAHLLEAEPAGHEDFHRGGAATTTRAGFPATMAKSGTSNPTTVDAPMMAPSPIEAPGRMTAPVPIQAFSPMTIGMESERGGVIGAPHGTPVPESAITTPSAISA